jgi:TPP-dependent pyruvate/acetoin dehydrogenase alpha subunit
MAADLPLLVICAAIDSGTHKPQASAMSWPSAQRLSTRCALPVLSVDGEDVVAVYRAVQESLLHIRFGSGPVLLWAVCSPRRPALAQQPVRRLQSYMRARGIPLA